MPVDQDAAQAVAVDGTTFQLKKVLAELEMLKQLGASQGLIGAIVQAGVKFATPAIEGEVQRQTASCIDQGDQIGRASCRGRV